MLKRYRLKEGVEKADYVIPGVGKLVDGEIETPITLESPILEQVGGDNGEQSNAHLNGVVSQNEQVINQPESEV